MRSKLQKQHHTPSIYTLGYGAIISLSLLALALLSPICPISSSALSPAELQTNMPTSGSIALALPGEATLDVVPTSSGSFSSATAKLSVSSTNPTGYSLYINTNDNTNALANVDSTKTATIPAVSGAQLGSQLDANTWGYNLSPTSSDALSLNYQAVPLKSSTPVLSTKASSSDSYYLTFGTKLDTSLPAGQYANTITISAIANPLYITGLLNLTYMQDMTSSVCANTVAYDGTNIKGQPGSEVTKQLIDSRDGKEYWVAKLADGNCWMTQNLALDLKANQTLTNANTDLNSKTSWVVPTTTETTVPAKRAATTSDYYTIRSWNLGEYVSIHPTGRTGCFQSGGVTDFNSLSNGQTFDICPEAFQNVKNWQPIFKASITDFASAIDATTKTYDAHYLIGNYYQFNTATAGSGSADQVSTTTNLVDVEDSICPKGWQLPTSGRQNDNIPADRSASFYRLFYAYDYPVAKDYKYLYLPGNFSSYNSTSLLYDVINGAHQDVDLSPIYITRPGYLYLPSGINNAVTNGFLWSSTVAEKATLAYYANFWGNGDESIMPNYSFSRHFGFGVRCLAR